MDEKVQYQIQLVVKADPTGYKTGSECCYVCLSSWLNLIISCLTCEFFICWLLYHIFGYLDDILNEIMLHFTKRLFLMLTLVGIAHPQATNLPSYLDNLLYDYPGANPQDPGPNRMLDCPWVLNLTYYGVTIDILIIFTLQSPRTQKNLRGTMRKWFAWLYIGLQRQYRLSQYLYSAWNGVYG